MTQVVDAQGQTKGLPAVVKGMIIAFYGTRIPEGWLLCDGTLGTPDLRGRVLIGDTAVGTGTAGGTEQADTGLTHSGFALGNHSNHAVTQPSAHSAHAIGQPSAHSSHVVTQPSAHAVHASQGAHTHDAHAFGANGSTAVAGLKFTAPNTHSSDGAHDHDDGFHAHTGTAVDAHSAHASAALDAHSAHSGAAFDAHSAHSMTQAGNHLYKVYRLCYIFKL